MLDELFDPLGLKPPVAAKSDIMSSLITAIETARGVALGVSVILRSL